MSRLINASTAARIAEFRADCEMGLDSRHREHKFWTPIIVPGLALSGSYSATLTVLAAEYYYYLPAQPDGRFYPKNLMARIEVGGSTFTFTTTCACSDRFCWPEIDAPRAVVCKFINRKLGDDPACRMTHMFDSGVVALAS